MTTGAFSPNISTNILYLPFRYTILYVFCTLKKPDFSVLSPFQVYLSAFGVGQVAGRGGRHDGNWIIKQDSNMNTIKLVCQQNYDRYHIAGNFHEHKSPTQQKREIYFATRSWFLTTPPTISHLEVATLAGNSVYFNVKMTVRGYHAYRSLWVKN